MFQNYPKIWKYHIKSNQGFNFFLWPKSFLRPSLCRKMNRFNLKRRIKRRFLIMQCSFRCYCDKFLMCSVGAKPIQYNLLPHSSSLHSMSCTASIEGGLASSRSSFFYGETDSDLVPLKITLLGDSHIGKTSFLEKYVGNQNEAEDGTKKGGLRTMDKTLYARGARISYRMWEVDGGEKSQVSAACIDSMAILFMFDLTSRCTLNNIISWYRQARRWNQKAIPIMIGTKFDDFIQLPLDLQWEIASQARGYAKLLNATLFFSSATYNINVNKIFKFITAKLFDLPWTVERNLTIGEPIIDF